MLNIKSIASTLGFTSGTVEQAAIVAGSSIKAVANKTYNGVSTHDYGSDFKEFKQEFTNGRVSGKEYVSTKLNKLSSESIQLLTNGTNVEIVTL